MVRRLSKYVSFWITPVCILASLPSRTWCRCVDNNQTTPGWLNNCQSVKKLTIDAGSDWWLLGLIHLIAAPTLSESWEVITDYLFQWLQLVKDTAARLVTWTGRHLNVTHVRLNYVGWPFLGMSTSGLPFSNSWHCTARYHHVCQMTSNCCLMSVTDCDHLTYWHLCQDQNLFALTMLPLPALSR